jgi:hypothetical protein
MSQQNVLQLLNDPLAQELLHSKILARLAYTGLDGSPRVVPIWFYWNNKQFVLVTPSNSPKVKALSKSPMVAMTIDENMFPPKALLVRGTAIVELVDGLVPEHIKAARKYLGMEQAQGWEKQARGMYKQEARIVVEPEWVKILDFETRFPEAIEEAISQAKKAS